MITKSALVGVIDWNFEIYNIMYYYIVYIIILFINWSLQYYYHFHEYCPKSNWESSGRNTSRLQFKSCESNFESSTKFQTDPSAFAYS